MSMFQIDSKIIQKATRLFGLPYPLTERTLQRRGELRTGLDHPRCAYTFLVADRKFLIVGSKTQSGIVIYERHKETGDLKEVVRNMDVIGSSCFLLL